MRDTARPSTDPSRIAKPPDRAALQAGGVKAGARAGRKFGHGNLDRLAEESLQFRKLERFGVNLPMDMDNSHRSASRVGCRVIQRYRLHYSRRIPEWHRIIR